MTNELNARTHENLEVIEDPKASVHGHRLVEYTSPSSMHPHEVSGQQL
jgi:hypothetical protein